MKCLNCKAVTSNPKFCSRSCSASYNNSKVPKRHKDYSNCLTCSISLKKYGWNYYSKYCKVCRQTDETTIDDMKQRQKYQKHSAIRSRARTIYRKSSKSKSCIACNYDKHYEVCHIKAINEFPGSSKLGEVNCLSNLVALCRNCHWEFDNGLLNLSGFAPEL